MDTQDSTNHTWSEGEVSVGPCADIECALYLIAKFRHGRIRIRGIVLELSSGRNRLSFLLLGLLFVVAEFSTIPTFERVVLVASSSMMALPSTKLPQSVLRLLLMVRVVFSGQLTLSASSRYPSISSTKSSSLPRLGVEHLTIGRIAPLSDVICFDQQY